MKNIAILLFILGFFVSANAQTVIEMGHPGDANLVLLEVDNPEKADIVIYRTDDKKEVAEWDCMWQFKKWGFSNFSVYLTKNPEDSLLIDNDMGVTYAFHGKVYFTDDKSLKGYKTPGFQLEGVFRRTGSNNSSKSKESKDQATQKALKEDGE
jgi:hypothetical protein